MNKFLKGIMIFSVFAAIFAVASIIFAINTKTVTSQYLELINTKSLHGKQLVRLVKQPDGTLLVEIVSPTSEDVKLPSGSVTESSPGGGPDKDDPDEPQKDYDDDPQDTVEPNDDSIIQFFKSKGYETHAAIGIAANLKAESNYNFKAGTHHKGVAQWDSGRWTAYNNWLSSTGKTDSLTNQCEYVYMEMNAISPAGAQYPGYCSVANLNGTSGKYHATKIIARYFERCPNINGGYNQIQWNSPNAYPDGLFNSSCQGGSTRLSNASAM